MKRAYINYVNRVVGYLNCRSKMKNKIKKDLLESLIEKEEDHGSFDPLELMGDPKEVAKEFSENLDLEIANDYVSKTRLFGMPLVHIVRRKNGMAKGIIAIGPISIGIFSIGGFSLGIFTFGGVSIGLIALGGIAAGYSALGGAAIAYDLAIGGAAVAYNLAIGGAAVAQHVAIGGSTFGTLSYYSQSFNLPDASAFAYEMNLGRDAFIERYEEMYLGFGLLKDWLIQLFI